MPNLQNTNQIFHALSDATRMAVIAQLSHGPASVSDLAKPYDMALPSFTQHLGVLEKSGLVRSSKQGRVRTYQLNSAAVSEAIGWLDEIRLQWEQRLDRLDNYLLAMKEQEE